MNLARKLGLFDAVMIVMGGIIGSGIFMNSYLVAREVHTPGLVLSAWALGGLIALAGAFIYAELAILMPMVGGQYAYLREAYHPLAAFLYGWVLLLVIQTGGMAAVSITFAKYFVEAANLPVSEKYISVFTLGILTIINVIGVRSGSNFQSFLMVLKILAILVIVVCGLIYLHPANLFGDASIAGDSSQPRLPESILAFGAAMTPIMFTFGGWQTATFVSGELKNPQRDLARGMLIGVAGVIALYLLMNLVYVGVLGVAGLAATTTPASTLMRQTLGSWGARFIAIGISVSTLGFLSQSMLTAPRVYFAMAQDKLFFPQVAWIHPRTKVPVVAVILQGTLAAIITLIGRYDRILGYVVSIDFIAFGLTAACVFVLRRRRQPEAEGTGSGYRFKIPGHPITTLFFVTACFLVVFSTVYHDPKNTAIGLIILLTGVPVYFLWRWKK